MHRAREATVEAAARLSLLFPDEVTDPARECRKRLIEMLRTSDLSESTVKNYHESVRRFIAAASTFLGVPDVG